MPERPPIPWRLVRHRLKEIGVEVIREGGEGSAVIVGYGPSRYSLHRQEGGKVIPRFQLRDMQRVFGISYF